MTLEEAEKNGCPKYVLNKLKRAGISYLDWGSSWEQLSKDADTLYDKLHPEEMFFGKKLKEVRLKAGFGLRKMSERMGMLASEYSDIERGYVDYRKEYLITKIKLILEGNVSKEDLMQLWDLYEAPFVMQKMTEGGRIFHATKNIEGSETACLFTGEIIPKTRAATVEECVEISEWMNERAREHNKKVDEFNNKEV